MVLERSFDTAQLRQLLAGSDMLMDRSLAERRHAPSTFSRPPLPKGSHLFEKVLDEFQPERLGPEIRVTGPTSRLKAPGAKEPGHGHQGGPSTHLRPRSPAVRSRPSSPALVSPGSAVRRGNSHHQSCPASEVAKTKAAVSSRPPSGLARNSQTLSRPASNTQLAVAAIDNLY